MTASAPMPPPTPAAGSAPEVDSGLSRERSRTPPGTSSLIARDLAAGLPQLVAQTEGMRAELSAMRGDLHDLERETVALRSEMTAQTQTMQQILAELQTQSRLEAAREAREEAAEKRRQEIEDARRERESAWEEEDRQRRLAREDEAHELKKKMDEAKSAAEIRAIGDRAKLRTKIIAAIGMLITTLLGALGTWLAVR